MPECHKEYHITKIAEKWTTLITLNIQEDHTTSAMFICPDVPNTPNSLSYFKAD